MPTFTTTLTPFEGVAVDRSTFRRILPDAKWYAYAAGWVNPGDGNVATLSLAYEKDDRTQITLGSTTATGAAWAKFMCGPFDVFGTASVPAGETVPVIRFCAQKDTGTDGTVEAVTLWIRYLPPKQ